VERILKSDLNLYPKGQKWQYCLNPRFETNIKEWHLRNGLRIMRNRSDAHCHLDGVVNNQSAILGVRESTCDSWELQRGLPSQVTDCQGQYSLKRQWTVSAIKASCAILLCLTFLLQVCR
jgi:hypothetical protein